MELTALRPEFLRIGLLHQGTFDYIKSGTFDYIAKRGSGTHVCATFSHHIAQDALG